MADAAIHVVVMYSPAPRSVSEWTVELTHGATLLVALEASGLLKDFPDVDVHTADTGIWGRKARLEKVLRDGDRVEIYRPLKVDPKVARRERFREQGTRAAGLFARKRAGAKPGY